MPMNDVVAAVIYAEHGTSKHAKASTPTPIMTNSSKVDGMHASTTHLGNMLAPSSIGLCAGQKWQQLFDLDKVIKQLRAAEKIYIRGGKASSNGGNNNADGHTKHASHSGGGGASACIVQVQRLNSHDMPYYDIVPKQASRDTVVCNACNGNYTKAGFNNHVALQHPTIWESIPNKVNLSTANDAYRTIGGLANAAAVATDNSQDGVREAVCAADGLGSPTETLSGTLSTCSNGSTSSVSLHSPYAAAAAAAVAAANSSMHSASASSTSSSSRHKSSKSSSSSSKAGSSSGSSSSRSRSKSSKNRHHSSPTSSSELSLHHSGHKSSSGTSAGGTLKKSNALANALGATPAASTATAAAALPTAVTVKEETPITVYSSSSNSSCSLPPTPKMEISEHGIGYTPAQLTSILVDAKHETLAAQPKKKLKASADGIDYGHHRTKLAKGKQMAPQYEQQLSELDQAVSSITGGGAGAGAGGANAAAGVDVLSKNFADIGGVASTDGYAHGQHQVDLSTVTEEPMPMHNASDDNSISLMLDDMLDSKFINEILNTAESDIPFDESTLDTSQQQQQQQQQNGATASYLPQQHQQQLPTGSKRIRYDDGTIHNDAGDYAAALYQQQQQQQQYEDIKVYSEPNSADIEAHEQSQLTAIDAMQLQQIIFQQQQMLEQTDQKPPQHMDISGYGPVGDQAYASGASEAASAQFSVYNVPSLTDDTDEAAGAGPQLDEHMILPNIIYEITEHNQVSVLDQQSQQQVIAEFLTQAGYDNVDVNVLQAAAAAAAAEPSNGSGSSMHPFSDEICDIDFTKLETVSADATSNLKTVKLEASQPQQAQPPASSTYSSYPSDCKPISHRQLVNAKYQEESYFNVLLYAGAPRPLAMNNFGLVKLPHGMGTTLRKNLLTTRKANNSLLSLNGSSGVVGNLMRQPTSNANNANNANASNSNTNSNLGLPRKTIYAQKSSIIVQDRLKCNKRALVSKLEYAKMSSNAITAKRLNDLLTGKLKPDREKADDNEASEQQQQQEDNRHMDNKRMASFYEKRRKLIASGQQHQHQQQQQQQHAHMSRHQQLMRQQSLHASSQLHSGNNANNYSNGNGHQPQQRHEQLLKRQLLRTLSDCGSTSNILPSNTNSNSNLWKSNNSTTASAASANDLMSVFV